MKTDLNRIDAKLLFESLIATLSLLFFIVLLIWNFSDYSKFYLFQIEYSSDDIGGIILIFVPSIFIGLIWIIYNIFTSIRLLSSKWNNNWCKSYKVLFGVISLFLFLSFFLLIFAFVAKYKINKEREQNINYYDYSNENTITRNLDFNKLKSYRTKSIASILLIVFIIILAILFSVNKSEILNSNMPMSFVWQNILIPVTALYLLINISMSFVIMFSSWDVDWCRKHRILFGLLSLIFSFITILIFANIGLKKAENQLHNLTKEVNDSYNNNYNQQIIQQPFQNNYPNFSDPNFNQNNNNNNNLISKPIVENYDDYDEDAKSKAGEVASTVAEAAGSVLQAIGDFLGSL